MTKRRIYKVKDVARISGVSVRALHHYDELGLLKPSDRSRAGYRLYTDDDLLRLQQILVGRELGMSLEAIRQSLDDPSFDRRAALQKQREELVMRAELTQRMLRSIDAALATLEEEDTMKKVTDQDLAAIFDGFDPAKYEDEVVERWGGTAAYKESAQRTKRYTKEDWERYRAESEKIMQAAATLCLSGAKPTDEEAMTVAEQHRLLIDQWFYPCPQEMHSALADMYEADTRFAKNIDRYGEGLTAWLSAAIRANGSRSTWKVGEN